MVIKELHPAYQNLKLCLRFEAVDETLNIRKVDSHIICIFSSRLSVELVKSLDGSVRYDYENNIWFKDEGWGTKNLMEFSVKLLGPDGRPLLGKRVPLEQTLMYGDSDEEVPDQAILRISSPLEIDGTTGRGLIKIRVLEVSKNHSKKRFAVRFSAANTATLDDSIRHVEPGLSLTFEVRSKRKKKKPKRTGTVGMNIKIEEEDEEYFGNDPGDINKEDDDFDHALMSFLGKTT